MKPLNLDNKPCSPISSNCVVWQGPDIPCIHLCTGDSISEVIHKLATELCEVLETLKVSNYDLTCFSTISCGPQNFQELVQFILDQLCLLEGGTPSSSGGTVIPITSPIDPKQPNSSSQLVTVKPIFTKARASETCPDCVVTIPDEFVVGTQRTMQLVDYAVVMGDRIAGVVTEVSLMNTQIADIVTRVRSLENTPAPSLAMPSFTISCQIGSLLSGSTNQIDTLLEEFINNVWCGYTISTGSATELTAAVGQACITDTSVSLVKGSAMSVGYAGLWVDDADYSSVANAINNIWISLCDVFSYLTSSNFDITTSDSNTVDLSLSADKILTAKVQDTGWVNLEGFSWYSGTVDVPGTRPQCRRVGNTIHFRGIAWIPLAKNYGVDDTILPLTAIDTYNGITQVGPATSGAGSMTIDAAGSLYWNNNTRVIPTTVLDAAENLDGPYRFQYPTLFSRGINIGGSGTMLNSAGRFGITSSGVLYFATLKDQEIISSGSSLLKGSSPLRYMNSNIRSGEHVPNFINADTDIQNLPAAGASNLVAESGFPNAGGTDVTWPISCDAAEETQVGGFYATLEGLTAFVDCSSTTATNTCY